MAAMPELLAALARLAHGAGRIILQVREAGINVRHKPDTSPVTQADEQAEAFIEQGLAEAFPGVAVVGEELVAAGRAPQPGRRFFLVDPLDGTKEFVAGRDSFSTNIALVEDGRAVAGVIHAPARGAFFAGGEGLGVWRGRLAADEPFNAEAFSVWSAPPRRREGLVAVVSYSHLDDDTLCWLKRRGIRDFARMGSAWKFSLLLTGEADVYPRLGPTSEWDTAAGQAVLEAAGGRVLLPEVDAPLTYGHHERKFLNPGFVALAPGVALSEEETGA